MIRVVLREMIKKMLQYLKWSKGFFVIFKFFVFAVFIVGKIVTGHFNLGVPPQLTQTVSFLPAFNPSFFWLAALRKQQMKNRWAELLWHTLSDIMQSQEQKKLH